MQSLLGIGLSADWQVSSLQLQAIGDVMNRRARVHFLFHFASRAGNYLRLTEEHAYVQDRSNLPGWLVRDTDLADARETRAGAM
jgi:hypothetical protein